MTLTYQPAIDTGVLFNLPRPITSWVVGVKFRSEWVDIPLGDSVLIDHRRIGYTVTVTGQILGTGADMAAMIQSAMTTREQLEDALQGHASTKLFDLYLYGEQFFGDCVPSSDPSFNLGPMLRGPVPVIDYAFAVRAMTSSVQTPPGGGPIGMVNQPFQHVAFEFDGMVQQDTAATEHRFENHTGRDLDIVAIVITGCTGGLDGQSNGSVITVADYALGGSGNSIGCSISGTSQRASNTGSLTWSSGGDVHVRCTTAGSHIGLRGYFVAEG